MLLGLVIASMKSIIQMTESNWGIAINLPYILFCGALILCYAFKQGRESMVCLAMLVAYFVIQHRLLFRLFWQRAKIQPPGVFSEAARQDFGPTTRQQILA